MRLQSLALLLSISIANAFFLNIIRGILSSTRYPRFIAHVPSDILQSLSGDENAAGAFICEILDGNIPSAFADLGEDIKDEVEGDFASITSFVESLPTLAPEILDDIADVAEDAVSFVQEFVNDPEGAVTEIGGKITSAVGGIASDVRCWFENCDEDNSPGASKLSSACAQVQTPGPATVEASPTPTVVVTVGSGGGDDGSDSDSGSGGGSSSADSGYWTPEPSWSTYTAPSPTASPSVNAAQPTAGSGEQNTGSGGSSSGDSGSAVAVAGNDGHAIMVNLGFMLAIPLLIVMML